MPSQNIVNQSLLEGFNNALNAFREKPSNDTRDALVTQMNGRVVYNGNPAGATSYVTQQKLSPDDYASSLTANASKIPAPTPTPAPTVVTTAVNTSVKAP